MLAFLAMSSTESTKKYRANLKQDADKYEEVKQKDRERKKEEYLKKKESLSPEVLRAKEREKKRKQRAKKLLAENPPKNQQASENSTIGISPQSFAKAVNRASN